MAKANPKPDIHVWCFRGMIDVVRRNYIVFSRRLNFKAGEVIKRSEQRREADDTESC